MNEARAELAELTKLLHDQVNACKGNHVFRLSEYRFHQNNTTIPIQCIRCPSLLSIGRINELHPGIDHKDNTVYVQEPFDGVAECLHDFFAFESEGVDYGKCKRCGMCKKASEIESGEWEDDYWQGK